MRPTFRPAAVAVVLVAALSAAGCVPGPVAPPTPAPTSTPLFASDEEALAAAEQAYAAYLSVTDQIFADGGKNPERLLAVATSSVLDAQAQGYSEIATKGWMSSGATVLDTVSLKQYDPTRVESIVSIYGCIDLSGVQVVDASGASVVSPTRPDRSPFEAFFDRTDDLATPLVVSGEKPWTGENFCV